MKANTGYFVPEVMYRKIDADRSDAILKYIGSRVLNYNKNFLCAITGPTGAGKSWAGIAMCNKFSKMYDIPFDVDIHTIHTLKQLLHLIKTKELEKKIQIGTPLLFEEPQATDGNARNWQSESNKMLAVLLSTFRNQRLVVFFSTPFLNMIDKQARILFHAEFKVISFDLKDKTTKIKPRFLEYNADMEKFYHKKLLVYYAREGKRYYGREKVSIWNIPKAPQELLDKYEEIKRKFSVDLVNKLWNQTNKDEVVEEKASSQNKYGKVKELYLKYGENYDKILSEMPDIAPHSLRIFINMIKKSANISQMPELST